MGVELYGLEERFAQVEAQVEALQAGLPAAPADPGADLAQAAEEGLALSRFLQDIEEALKQLFVAGVAYPDPELPDELEALSERAARHGLGTAVGSLLRLKAWLEGISGQRDLLVRQQMAQRAWDEAQRFLAWLRLLRGEHDFLLVQGRMASEATGEVQDNRASFPTRSATVWPLGMELDSGGRLLVFCQEVETGRYVLLRDQLAEFDAQDPLGGRAISRLFQDAIRLSRLFESVVRLEDHPVVARAATWLFRPAFQASPRMLPVSSAFRAPEIPELELEPNGEPRVSRAIPSLLRGYLVMHQGRPDVRLQNHGTARLQGGETLRLNLTKLLLRERVERLEVEVVVMPRDEGLLALSLRTDFDGRVFPAQDPTLFRLSGDVVNARAQERAAKAPGSLGALWLQGVAVALGGASAEVAASVRAQMAAFAPVSVQDHYRLGLLRFLHQEAVELPTLPGLLRDLFALVLKQPTSSPDALALALGRDPAQTSAAELRLLDGQVLYQAVWLAIEADLVDALRDSLRMVYNARYQGELKEPSPGDLCARALLMGALELGHDAEDYGGPEGDGTGPAMLFLGAHLAEIASGRKGARAMPLPELIEVYQLSDTMAWLQGADRYSAIARQAGFAPDRVVQPIADALLRWDVVEAHDHSDAALLRAGDALLLTMFAALRPWLIL